MSGTAAPGPAGAVGPSSGSGSTSTSFPSFNDTAARRNQIVEWILATIRQRESGNNYTARNPSSSASGAYQFIDSTWRGLGGTGRAYQASPAEQDRIARAYVIRILDAHNWDLRAVPAIWYTGRYDPNNIDYVPSPGAGNHATVRSYIDGWMRTFNGFSNGTVQVPATPSSGSFNADGQQVDYATSTVSSGVQPGESIEDAARRLYGYLGSFLDHPEIGPILRQAAEEGWDQNRLMGALYATQWWKTTSESARQWDALLSTDPAEAQRQLSSREAEIRDLAAAIGIQVSVADITEMATGSLRFGIDPNSAEFRDTLAARIPDFGEGSVGPGTFQATIDQIKQLANADYMVGISDDDAWRMAQQVMAGDLTMDGVKAQFLSVARGRFAYLSDVFDNGVTPGQYFAPYRNMIADQLEISADQVDLMSPEYSSITGINTDHGMRPMTFSEAQQFIRQKPQWATTSKARDLSSSMARQLAESMGMAVF